MALSIKHKETQFGVGDVVRISQRIKEGEKQRIQITEGTVISIKGRNENKTFTVRRIGAQQIGIERIIPLFSPTVEKIEIVRKGMQGVRHAKLFYIRKKSKRQIERIYSRSNKRISAKK